MAIDQARTLPELDLSISQVVAAWPEHRPLVMLHSAGRHEQWGRWSVLSSPPRYESLATEIDDADRWLRHTLNVPDSEAISGLPFVGGWIGYFSYELGRQIESAARWADVRSPAPWPLIEFAWCPVALIHDNFKHMWYAVGDIDAAQSMIDQLQPDAAVTELDWRTGELSCAVAADAHLGAIAQTLEYIAAGDIFQANITQQFHTPFNGCTRALARHALATSGARYGAYLELPNGRCIISMSPELFLQVDAASKHITTRPVKGTRPASTDPQQLSDSAKDAAELHMITDLMRNDLGRVCEFGSIHVDDARSIESHPTVHHGVSTITGRLRSGVQLPDLLAATFPGGSITGAPKIRAMQIIEQLEQRPRGPYCGAIGMISRSGDVTLNIAIRTMLLNGTRPSDSWNQLNGMLTYGAGGGIVADSEPMAEYRECMDKAAVLRQVLAASSCEAGLQH